MGKISRIVVSLLCFYLLAYLALAVYHYRFPEPFTLKEAGYEADNPAHAKTAVVRVLIRTIKDMRRDWQPNDLYTYPTRSFLDNPRNFQYGQLEAVRDVIIVMRESLGRLRTNDKKNPRVVDAYNCIANDSDKWVFPSFEGKLACTHEALAAYLGELERGEEKIYPHANNAKALLERIASLLGAEARRLHSAYGRTVITSEETALDATIHGERKINVRTPWLRTDDDFYHAQGVLYTAAHVIAAFNEDFGEIIEDKQSLEFAERVAEVLDPRAIMESPLVVLSCTPRSLCANHLQQLVGDVETARQYIGSFQRVLQD